MMGRLIASMDLVPDRVISSTAVRAASTAVLASDAGEWGLSADLEDRLYGSGVDEVLQAASRADGERLMLVGHEPTWSMLVKRLTGASVQMKTASLAVIDLMIDEWSELPHSRGVLALLIHPRQFFGSEWDPEP